MRASLAFFSLGVVLMLIGTLSLLYVRGVERDFSAKTSITMGTVVEKGSLLHRTRRSHTEAFCWVSYEFTAPDRRTRKNWHFWEPACGTSRGRAIPVQFVVADPDLNRPADSEPWFPWWLCLFAGGVAMVVAFLIRRAESDRSQPTIWDA